MNRLLDALPERYAACGQITLLLEALETELEALEQAVRTTVDRGLVARADQEGLVRWERDLGLAHRPDLTAEGRRAMVLAALDRSYDGTPAGLETFARRLTGTADAAVTQDPAAYTVTLTTGSTDLVDVYSLQDWVRRRLPAHLTGIFLQTET